MFSLSNPRFSAIGPAYSTAYRKTPLHCMVSVGLRAPTSHYRMWTLDSGVPVRNAQHNVGLSCTVTGLSD